MLPKNREPTAPGVILREIMEEKGITQAQLHQETGIGLQTINTLLNGRRGLTADTALRLAKRLKTTPEFWMNLQTNVDLWRASQKMKASGRAA